MTLDKFVDTSIRGYQNIICNITKLNKYFIGILNSWIEIPINYTKCQCPTNINDFTVIITPALQAV